MATVVIYDFNVKLLRYRNLEQRINRQALNPTATMILVSFVLQKKQRLVQFITQDTLAIFLETRRPRRIKSELTRVTASDLRLGSEQQCLRTILTDMDIPESKQSEILDEISSKACGINTCSCVFMMMVDIDKLIYEEIDSGNNEGEDISEEESMEVEDQPIPATKSSIDALERVVLDGSGAAKDCTICMEEIEAGSEAIRMPCSHVYHSDCIVQWLQTSHLCPLCRYQLPQVNVDGV